MGDLNFLIYNNSLYFRARLELFLIKTYPQCLINYCYQKKDVLEYLKDKKYEVLLIGFSQNHFENLELVRTCRKINPHIKIIVLSKILQKSIVHRLFKEGINGLLQHNANEVTMRLLIHHVLDGELCVSIDGASRLYKKEVNQQEGTSKLTAREIEILKLICDQLSTIEIAERLGLSIKTVENFRINIMRKTGSKNMVGVVLYAFKNNLLLPLEEESKIQE